MNAADLIRAAEGYKRAVYDDATGEPVPVGGECKGTATVGIGHTGPDVKPGDVWTDDQIEGAFPADYAEAEAGACNVLGEIQWGNLDEVRRAVLIDMAFEMGEHGLSEFHGTLGAIRRGDWQAAHDGVLTSLYAHQAPRRAKRNAQILLTGEWPQRAEP